LSRHLVRRYSTSAPRPATDPTLTGERLRRVLDHVHEHLGVPLTLADLAAVGGLPADRFGRAFRLATGKAPYQYVLTQRLAKAADLLARTDTSIADIAYRVGMSSQSHLTTAFGKAFGETPAAFRRTRT
jgi:AraC family transcriptional regulator